MRNFVLALLGVTASAAQKWRMGQPLDNSNFDVAAWDLKQSGEELQDDWEIED